MLPASAEFFNDGAWCGTTRWICKTELVERIGLDDPYAEQHVRQGLRAYRLSADDYFHAGAPERKGPGVHLPEPQHLLSAVATHPSARVTFPGITFDRPTLYGSHTRIERIAIGYLEPNDPKLREFLEGTLSRWHSRCVTGDAQIVDGFYAGGNGLIPRLVSTSSGHIVWYSPSSGHEICAIMKTYFNRGLVPVALDCLMEFIDLSDGDRMDDDA